MELRVFLNLFIRRRQFIFGVLALSLVIGFLAYRLQSPWYEGTMLLSVTRQGTETTAEYQYDHAYRLQADERMANTVARYLETPLGRRETARRALLSGTRETEFIESRVETLVLSTNLIQVSYRTQSPTESERIADGIVDAGESYLFGLNEQAAYRNWFTLMATDSFTRDGRFSLFVALGLGGVMGLFLAVWVVLGWWYWNGRSV